MSPRKDALDVVKGTAFFAGICACALIALFTMWALSGLILILFSKWNILIVGFEAGVGISFLVGVVCGFAPCILYLALRAKKKDSGVDMS